METVEASRLIRGLWSGHKEFTVVKAEKWLSPNLAYEPTR
jgi:hypothetical protein